LGVLGCLKGDSRLFFWFLAAKLWPTRLYLASYSAEVFSMSKPFSWRLLVETATSIQGQAMHTMMMMSLKQTALYL